MQGIAIQPGFPGAGASAARKTPPASDNRFSNALQERPKAPAQADRKTDHAMDDVGSRHGGKDDKVGQPAHAKNDRDSTDDDCKKKDEDDKDGSALPPHMMAERTLAGQWPGSAPAAAANDAPVAAGTTGGGVKAAAPAAGGIQMAAGVTQASAVQTAATQAGTAAIPTQQLTAQTPTQAAPPQAEPALKGVSVVAATAAKTGKAAPDNASAAFMVRVAAAQHGAGPAGSAQATGSAASAPVADAKADAVQQISQALSGQGSANSGANPDGQGGDNDGMPGKGAPGTTPLSASAKGDAAGTPLPTAQMLPVSGSAPSFAGALTRNGSLARYVASAAAAIAAGTPANALPVRSLSIQLRPVELGSVTANLKYAGSGLTIDIQVETPEAHRRLSNDSSDIVKSLQSLGFQVDKVTVRQASAQMQPQQPQPQGQAQGQATGRDGSAGGFANQGGSPFSMSGQSGGSGQRQGSERGYEGASERGIGMVRETPDRLPRRGVFI